MPTLMLSPYQRETFDSPAYGQAVVDYDPASGTVLVEFERLETNEAIMPQYRVSLTTEHVAAWVEQLLTTNFGRRCKRAGEGSRKRLQIMLKLTEKDTGLVYCIPSGANVILVRGGCVLRVRLCLTYSMTEFAHHLREEATDPTAAGKAFVDFVHGLLT